jgi:hypothetical protein
LRCGGIANSGQLSSCQTTREKRFRVTRIEGLAPTGTALQAGPKKFHYIHKQLLLDAWLRGWQESHKSHLQQPHSWSQSRCHSAENMGSSQANKEWCVGAATLNNKTTFEVCRTPPLTAQHETAIVDSGCTCHFLLVNAPCLNKVKSWNPLTVRLPNGATVESSHTADLDIPGFNSAASKAHVFPGMELHSLISIGQLCQEGYIVTFHRDTVTIHNSKSSKLLTGPRDITTGLWRINLKHTNTPIPNPIENNVYA